MTFCKIPFHGLNLRNDGTIRTCCSSIGQMSGIRNTDNKPINITDNNSLEQAFNSNELKDLRKRIKAQEAEEKIEEEDLSRLKYINDELKTIMSN